MDIVTREDDTRIIVSGRDKYPKSNFLIASVYKSTLAENRVLAIMLNKIDRSEEDREGSLICKVKVEEIKEILGIKGHSIYEYLDTIGKRMTAGGRTIGFSDPEHHEFMYVPLVTKAACKNGEFYVRFAPEMKPYLKDMRSQYTELSLRTMLGFESVYSLRLFELLRSFCYHPKGVTPLENDIFQIKVQLSQLKLQMGVVNGELAKIRNTLTNTGKKGEPDYDLAVSRAEEKMYNSYSEFRRKCLDPSVKEINEKDTGMNVEYSPIRAGKGAKTVGIVFSVKLTNSLQKGLIMASGHSYDNVDDFIDALRDSIDNSVKLKTSEMRKIAELVEFDLDIAIKAIKYTQKMAPDNFIGYLYDTIKYKYYENEIVIDGSHTPQKHAASKNIKKTDTAVETEEIPPLRAEDLIKKMT